MPGLFTELLRMVNNLNPRSFLTLIILGFTFSSPEMRIRLAVTVPEPATPGTIVVALLPEFTAVHVRSYVIPVFSVTL